jgi:hypothetical protein
MNRKTLKTISGAFATLLGVFWRLKPRQKAAFFMTLPLLLSLSGCSGAQNAGLHLQTIADFDARINSQQELVRYLADANALNQQAADAMISQTVTWDKFLKDALEKNGQIGDAKNGETSTFIVANSQQFSQMQASLSMVNQASILGKGTHQYTYDKKGELKEQNGGLNVSGSKNPKPYGFSGDDMKSLQQAVRYKVKVLKDHMEKDVTLDALSKAIQKCKQAGVSDAKSWGDLEGYFADTGKVTTTMPILHATFPWDGNSYKLGSDKDAQEVPPLPDSYLRAVYGDGNYGAASIDIDIWDATYPDYENGGWKFKEGYEAYMQQDNITQMHDLKIWTTGYLQSVHFDENGSPYIVIEEAPELAGLLRLEQVNKLFVDIITGKSSSDKMFINAKSNTFYLIEYPTYMLDQITLINGGKDFTTTLKESDIVINIAVGEIRRRTSLTAKLGKKAETGAGSGSGGSGDTGGTSRLTDYKPPKTDAYPADTWNSVKPVNQANTNIYKLTESHVQADEALSLVPTSKMTDRLSFIFDGGVSVATNLDEFPWADEGAKNNDKYAVDSGAARPEILSARIVLTDYAELLDIPGVVDGEQFVAMGRFFRVKRFAGGLTDVFAVYLDGAGNEMPEIYTSFKVTDLLDAASGKEKTKLERGVVSAETGTETDVADIDTAAANSSHRKTNYVNSIKTAIRFPSEDVDRVDFVNDASSEKNRPVIYGIKVDLNPFATNLYAGWVKLNDESGNSLAWWNKWLSENYFNYHIDVNRLDQSFLGNYGFEMQQSGMIMFDPVTIQKIQEDMNARGQRSVSARIKAIFIVFGVVLMFYSMCLPFAWFIDINLAFGIKLLPLLTGGRIQAVPYKCGGEEVGCATIKDILIISGVVMALSTALTVLDAVSIISAIVQGLSSLVRAIRNMIFN